MGRLLGIAAALALVALALVVGVLLINPPAVAQAVKAEALPRVSASLGRRVDAGEVRVRLLPRPRAVLEDVRVAGAPGEAPMVRARRVSGSLALGPLLRSRGRTIEITSLTLEEPEVVLVREPGGRWSFEGLGGAPSAPGRGPSRQAAIEEAAVRRGTLHIIDRTAEPAVQVTVGDIDARARGLGTAGSESVELRAAVFADRQNLRADARSQGQGGQGGAAAWSGQISLSSASLDALRQALPGRVPESVRGGMLDLRATFAATSAAALQAQGQLSVRALQVGGRPASASSDFTVSEAPAGGLSASLTNLAVTGPGLDLGGRVDLAGPPPSIRFALSGKTLNVDALKAATGSAPRGPSRASGPPPLASARASGTLHFDEVLAGGLAAQDVNAQAALQRGVLTLSRCQARLYGGDVSADGTRVDLRGPAPAWSLRSRFQGVDLASAQRAATGKAPLEGRAQGDLVLDGAGFQWKTMEPTLTGQGTVRVADATLTTVDLDRQLAGTLSGALSTAGVGGSPAGAPPSADRRGTPLRDLNFSFRVADGAVQLTQPLHASTDLGDASLGGTIGLDQRLHLSGTVALSPKAIAGISGGKIGLAQNVTLPVSVGGTLSAPAFQLPSQAQIAEALVTQGPVGGAMRQLGQELQRQAGQGIQRSIPLP